MDEFVFSFHSNINKREFMDLNQLNFIDKQENILYVGSSGVWKTHLAVSIGISAAGAHYSTYFITFEAFMNQLKKLY